MPYISSDRVKEIRNELKREFPNFKMSITCRHNHEVSVVIRSSPLQFNSDNFQVNPYWLEQHWAEENPQAYDVFSRMVKIMNSGNYTVVEDSDYGSIPKFYINLQVGDWNRPYVTK
jgi:hypothetical protein